MKNTRITLEPLNYFTDSLSLFESIKDLPKAALLDSCHSEAGLGRYDILTASPLKLDLPTVPSNASEKELIAYFDTLNRIANEEIGISDKKCNDQPFVGGLLGFLDYDLGLPINKVSKHPKTSNPKKTSAHIAGYSWAVIQDHKKKTCVLASLPSLEKRTRVDILNRLKAHSTKSRKDSFRLLTPFKSNMNSSEYHDAFLRIKKYILEGDCYQINLAMMFEAGYEGDPWEAYKKLRAISASPYSAYIQESPDTGILCLSPERFLSFDRGNIKTSPIKGTRPRKPDPSEDEIQRMELLHSEKDRAENIMIVDLLRNDLGKVCIPGSINAKRLLEVKTYSTIHHLVSTISGRLQEDKNIFDLIYGCFPGGSITGAPKRRAMEIINELEPDSRSAYCGSVIYFSANGRMDSNIAIRTLKYSKGQMACWGGGGIVADSIWEEEHQEIYDKIGPFLKGLNESFSSSDL